jgi:hypothetical protein
MTKTSTAPESRARAAAFAKGLADPTQRRMLETWLDHWWAEVVYDIDTAMRTVSDDVSYRMYGAATMGEGLEIDGKEAARSVYQSMFDDGLMPGGPFDEEKFSFASWGMMMEALFTAVYPGAMLPGVAGLEPETLYLMRWRMVVSFPFDLETGVLKGEIMYPGPPVSLEPTDRGEIARLLGRQGA